MLSGRQFKLARATLALEIVDGKRLAVALPAGAIVKVVSGPVNGNGFLDVLWDDKIVGMFEVDVIVRGTEITDRSVSA